LLRECREEGGSTNRKSWTAESSVSSVLCALSPMVAAVTGRGPRC